MTVCDLRTHQCPNDSLSSADDTIEIQSFYLLVLGLLLDHEIRWNLYVLGAPSAPGVQEVLVALEEC